MTIAELERLPEVNVFQTVEAVVAEDGTAKHPTGIIISGLTPGARILFPVWENVIVLHQGLDDGMVFDRDGVEWTIGIDPKSGKRCKSRGSNPKGESF